MLNTEIIFLVIQLIIGVFLLLPVINVIGGYYSKERKYTESDSQFDFAVIITAYNNIDLVNPLVKSLLKQTYKNFLIYIVADNCSPNIYQNSDQGVKLLIPPKQLNSKSRSIEFAISKFTRKHDNLIIFDSDNLAHPKFIQEINNFFNRGYVAVQGERVAKNLDENIAGIDALGEMFYNTVDRQFLYKLGSSSTLAGSGMAFNIIIYKELMWGKHVLGGFDKILQGELLSRDYKIAYAKKAIVYDEKVSESAQLRKQRTRWIFTYFRYLYYGFNVLIKGIKSLSFNQFYFGLNHLRPPLFILALVSALITAINIFYSPVLSVLWGFLGIIFTLNFLLILKLNNANPQIWASLKKIPYFILSQVLSLLKIKQASKNFLTTSNSQNTTIDDVLSIEEK